MPACQVEVKLMLMQMLPLTSSVGEALALGAKASSQAATHATGMAQTWEARARLEHRLPAAMASTR